MVRWILLLCAVCVPYSSAAEDAIAFVKFVEEPSATCVSRSGVQVLVRNTHPTRMTGRALTPKPVGHADID